MPEVLREAEFATPSVKDESPLLRQPRLHLGYLDGIRGLAALYVVLHHAWLQTWPTIIYGDRPHGLTAICTDWLLLGHFAVTVFITLSGFCLMLPVVRSGGLLPGGWKRFIKGRVRRILPPYYAALGLSLAMACWCLKVHTHTLYDASLPVTAQGVLSHLILIHNLTTTAPQINGPLWSVAVECQIYLFFPVLVWMTRRWGIFTTLISTCLSSLLMYNVFLRSPGLGRTPYYYLLVFAMGMFAAKVALCPDEPSSPENRRLGTLIGVALLSCIIAVGGYRYFPGAHIPSFAMGGAVLIALFYFGKYRVRQFARLGALAFLLWGILAAAFRLQHLVFTDLLVGLFTTSCLIALTRTPTGRFHAILSHRYVVWLGSFSYSFYLVHFPLQQLFWQYCVAPYPLLHGSIGFLIVAVGGTAFILPVAYGFYWLVERPFAHRSTAAAKPKPVSIQPAWEPAEVSQ